MVEFWDALKRQWVVLAVGFVSLLAGVVSLGFRVEDLSFEPRLRPEYTATIQMAVVPVGVDSLSDVGATGNYETSANFYAQLLQSPRAAEEIARDQDVELTDLIFVGVVERTGIMAATVQATTEDGATRAALGAFRWLEQALAKSPVVAAVPESEGDDPSLEVVEGTLSPVQLQVAQSYGLEDLGVWLAVSTPVDDGFEVPLVDAPFISRGYPLVLDESQTVRLSIEDEAGRALSGVDLVLPVIAADDDLGLPVVIDVPSGAILVADDLVELRADAITIQWELSSLLERQQGTAQLSVMRLTDDPIIGTAGAQRIPVMVGGAMIGGLLLLLAFATTRDSFQRARRDRLSEEDLRRLQESERI